VHHLLIALLLLPVFLSRIIVERSLVGAVALSNCIYAGATEPFFVENPVSRTDDALPHVLGPSGMYTR
jgi:hypothetical protein